MSQSWPVSNREGVWYLNDVLKERLKGSISNDAWLEIEVEILYELVNWDRWTIELNKLHVLPIVFDHVVRLNDVRRLGTNIDPLVYDIAKAASISQVGLHFWFWDQLQKEESLLWVSFERYVFLKLHHISFDRNDVGYLETMKRRNGNLHPDSETSWDWFGPRPPWFGSCGQPMRAWLAGPPRCRSACKR